MALDTNILNAKQCPITGLKITSKPEWSIKSTTNSDYAVTIVVVGKNIFYIKSWGYSTESTSKAYIVLFNKILSEIVPEDEKFFLLEDYSEHTGASIAGKNNYIKTFIRNNRVAGMFFIDSPAIFRSIIRLGIRIYKPMYPVKMVKNYNTAILMALHNFNKENNVNFNFLSNEHPTWSRSLDSCKISYVLINDYILHYSISGTMTESSIDLIVELFETVMQETGFAKGGQYFLISNLTDYKGSSFFLKRKIQKAVATSFGNYPCAINFVYGISFLKKILLHLYRKKTDVPTEIVRNVDEAISIIIDGRRNKKYKRDITKDKKVYSQSDVNEIVTKLLNFIGEVNWDKDGFKNMDKIKTESSAFSHLYESIALIKFDLNALMTEKDNLLYKIENTKQKVLEAEKRKAIGQEVGGIAHDFNNMLSSISGLSEILKRRYAKKESLVVDYANMIKSTTDRAASLTKKLLSYSRRGKHETVPQDIHFIISETLKLVSHSINRNVKISTNFYKDNPKIIGDSSQLLNMFMNLAINAGDAMPVGGKLEILTEKYILTERTIISNIFKLLPGDYIKISFCDTGKGINDNTIINIFESLSTTNSLLDSNSKLGLASVLYTVKNYNGSIAISSIINKGSTFEILLPITSMRKTYTAINSIKSISKNASILYYNPENKSLFTTSEMLKELGYFVDTTYESSLFYKSLISKTNINAIVMCFDSNNVDAIELLNKITKQNEKMKILIISNHSKRTFLDNVKIAENVSFLEKPFTILDLSLELSKMLPELYDNV